MALSKVTMTETCGPHEKGATVEVDEQRAQTYIKDGLARRFTPKAEAKKDEDKGPGSKPGGN